MLSLSHCNCHVRKNYSNIIVISVFQYNLITLFSLISLNFSPYATKLIPRTVYYHAQPMSQRALLRASEGEAHGCAFHLRRKGARSLHQRLFEEKCRKNRKGRGLRTLSERFGSCIYARGRN